MQEDTKIIREDEARKGLRSLAIVEHAKRVLLEGLKYHEHDGHNMPKKVARDALEALGVKRDDQPD